MIELSDAMSLSLYVERDEPRGSRSSDARVEDALHDALRVLESALRVRVRTRCARCRSGRDHRR